MKSMVRYPFFMVPMLGIVAGRVNPRGLRVGYRRVRVRVDLLLPGQNPYPICGYHGYFHLSLRASDRPSVPFPVPSPQSQSHQDIGTVSSDGYQEVPNMMVENL
jgi:hypothetical protein